MQLKIEQAENGWLIYNTTYIGEGIICSTPWVVMNPESLGRLITDLASNPPVLAGSNSGINHVGGITKTSKHYI